MEFFNTNNVKGDNGLQAGAESANKRLGRAALRLLAVAQLLSPNSSFCFYSI